MNGENLNDCATNSKKTRCVASAGNVNTKAGASRKFVTQENTMIDKSAEQIAAMYSLTPVEYRTMTEKIHKIQNIIDCNEEILQSDVYDLIEQEAVNMKEAIMITAGIVALKFMG